MSPSSIYNQLSTYERDVFSCVLQFAVATLGSLPPAIQSTVKPDRDCSAYSVRLCWNLLLYPIYFVLQFVLVQLLFYGPLEFIYDWGIG